MKVSLQLANEYSNVDLLAIPTEELLTRIGAQLGAVEEVFDWRGRFEGVIVARVVSCKKHSNADKLSVCLIDDNRVAQNVERDKDGFVQVVCGAPNVRAGITVAWLPPGSVVPSTRDKDPFTLEARELRGEISNGMLASSAELGLSDDHAGILELESDAQPGAAFGTLYGLNDVVIDCENKMFTHRPDCFGVLGVARELAGITGQQFHSPDWYSLTASKSQSRGGMLELICKNEIPDSVPRFMAQVVENVQVRPSRLAIQTALARQGSRPINNLVDATNFYMHLTSQPTHAFDYDKVKKLCEGPVTIFPRMAVEGEELKLLTGKTVKLTAKDIVIATDTQAIALGGVMGGAATEVDENTKNIIIECANFDMYTIRRTSMRHGIFSDAVTRFNKGQSYLQNPVVLHKLVEDICTDTGALAGVLFDSAPEEDTFSWEPIAVETEFINSRLGSNLTAEEMQTLLLNVEFNVELSDSGIVVTAPFWRTDIDLPEDIVEEIGRLNGFDKLSVELPKHSATPVTKNRTYELHSQLRSCLSRAGANEILTYSFVPASLLEACDQNVAEAYKLSNALSPELQYYRLTLTPSVLSKVTQNIRAGYDSFALFEIGKTHLKLQGVDDEGLPQETGVLSLVYATNDKSVAKQTGSAYFEAKVYLEYLAKTLGLVLDYEPLTEQVTYEITKPFDWQRSALVTDRNSGNYIGVIGEFKNSVRKKLKLPNHTAGFEIMTQPILDATKDNPSNKYHPLSKFPGTAQDITFIVPVAENFGSVSTILNQTALALATDNGYKVTSEPLDIYHKDNAKQQSYTFRLHLEHPSRTLTTEEVNSYIETITKTVQSQFKVIKA